MNVRLKVFFLCSIFCLLTLCACKKKNHQRKGLINVDKEVVEIRKELTNTQKDSGLVIVKEKKQKPCQIIIPEDDDSKLLIKENPLLDHYKQQKEVLEQFSLPTNYSFDLKGMQEYYTGIFSCGVLELTVTKIDGGHGIYLDGLVDEKDSIEKQVSFLVYGRIPNSKIDNIKYGSKHKMHWIETIANMGPFGGGYERLFMVFKIE